MNSLSKFLVVLVLVSCASAPAKKKTSYLDLVVTNIQRVWNNTKTFRAPFRQTVESKLMGTKETSEGTITVVKPDKFRWESKTDGSIQIINKGKLTFVQPKAQRGRTVVDIYPDFRKKTQVKFLDFLAGNVQLRKLYRPKLLSSKGKTVRILLTPKDAAGETYIAEIEKKSYLLQALTYESAETKTRMVFVGPKINKNADAKLFEYNPGKNDIVNYNK